MPQTIGIPKETAANEKRVACVPEVAEKLLKLGFNVCIEDGAGLAASYDNQSYMNVGAIIASEAKSVWQTADVVFKVRAPDVDEIALMYEGQTLISFIWPAQHPELIEQLAKRKVNVLAMDCVPRITRAQKMDALSSMANIAGYRAVIEAAHHFGRFFTGQITAAGKVPPAKVFVIGAGVAGLAAIGTSSGLGAIVRANDTRPEVADQVRSMGAEFVPVDYQEDGEGTGGYAKSMSDAFLQAQADVFARQAAEVDIIITTALIPGKPAPRLISEQMVDSMQPGSVIVDLAAEQGGNCACSVADQVVERNGVKIIGYTDLPSRLSRQSSTLYSTNLLRLSEELCKNKDGEIFINFEDEALRGATVIKAGNVTWPPPAPKPVAKPPVPPPQARQPVMAIEKVGKKASAGHAAGSPMSFKSLGIIFTLSALLLALIGHFAPMSFVSHFTVFVLACFVGYMVIWNVTPALHTPLMSVTNAISSIIAIGALVQIAPPVAEAADRPESWILGLAVTALTLTAVNMFGGFAVTRRMLAMFRKD